MLNNKKVLIAGAGGLLGYKVVAAALEHGAEIIAADINISLMKKRLEESGLNLDGSKVTLCELDLTNEKAVVEFMSKQEGLTGAVNCTYPRNKTYGAHFFDVSLDSFNENVSLHLGSSFLFMQQCAKYFQKNQASFSLVNISSIYGVMTPKFDVYDNTPMTMPVEYAAIKSAIIHLNKYVSAYIKDSRFRVNSVSPGGIYDSQPEAFLNAYKSHTHGQGMLDIGDVVGSIVFLLSDNAKYITGQNLIVDDGFSL